MRIIAGDFRGRRLLPPDGQQTRPVTDRVKQSVFDVLAHLLPDAHVYDCFAGTGSFGLESLSRGAKHVTFFESHRPTISRLRQNLATLGCVDRASIVTTDCFAHLRLNRPPHRADVVFLDPPYRYLVEQPDDLRDAAADLAAHHLAADGVVAFRHDAADQLALPALPPADVRSYGSMTVEFLKRPTENPPPMDADERGSST